jgi:hypothetical protein
MFVEQRQHTWRSRGGALVLITAANSRGAPLLPFGIGNSYFTHTAEEDGQQETEKHILQNCKTNSWFRIWGLRVCKQLRWSRYSEGTGLETEQITASSDWQLFRGFPQTLRTNTENDHSSFHSDS